MKKVVILISGDGSNMRALVDSLDAARAQVVLIVSNRPAAAGLIWAQGKGLPTACLDHTSFVNRAAFDAQLLSTVLSQAPDWVLLAGFMRVLNADFVRAFSGRLINIHPSLLPAFPGLDTHSRALQAGVALHGASVHYVTEQVDGGQIIIQGAITVSSQDTPESLSNRVRSVEHQIYPLALQSLLSGTTVPPWQIYNA
jgi:phosphoribosylglycinamide formyltransferase 1